MSSEPLMLRKFTPTCDGKGFVALATVVGLVFFGLFAFVDTLSAAGLDDFTADARLAVTSVTINDGETVKIFDGARLVAGSIVHHELGYSVVDVARQ